MIAIEKAINKVIVIPIQPLHKSCVYLRVMKVLEHQLNIHIKNRPGRVHQTEISDNVPEVRIVTANFGYMYTVM